MRLEYGTLARTLSLLTALFVSAIGRADGIREPVTYEKIESFLHSHPKVRNIEQLLPWLPKDLRSRYVLMHDSQSLQEASAESPRVILREGDGKLLLAFNGDPDQSGFTSLELIQYRDATQSFELHEIVFPGRDNPEGKIRFSKTNPMTCLVCHGDDPRPNWEHYSKWPGAIAGDDDRLGLDSTKVRSGFKRFLEFAPHHPRYRHLEALEEHYRESPQLARPSRTIIENNSTMTQTLGALNLRRVVRLLKATPDYAAFKYALAGAIFCHESFYRFFPKKLQRLADTPLEGFEDYSSYPIKNLMRLLEQRGISTKDWSMDFRDSGHPSNPGFTLPSSVELDFLGYWKEADSDLAPYFRGMDLPAAGADCPRLEEKSRALLRNLPSSQPAIAENNDRSAALDDTH